MGVSNKLAIYKAAALRIGAKKKGGIRGPRIRRQGDKALETADEGADNREAKEDPLKQCND